MNPFFPSLLLLSTPSHAGHRGRREAGICVWAVLVERSNTFPPPFLSPSHPSLSCLRKPRRRMENLSSSDTERHHTVSLPKQPSPDVFPPLEVSGGDSHHCHPVTTCPLVSHAVSQHGSAFQIMEQMKSLHKNSPLVVAISTQHHLALVLAGQRLCPCLCVQLEKCFHPQTRRAPP